MKTILSTYVSLLADIASISEVPLYGFSVDTLLDWSIIDAPKLEKHVLRCLERNEDIDISLFPTWLRPLVARFSLTREPLLLRLLRQVLLFSYKAEYAFTDEQVSSQVAKWERANALCAEAHSLCYDPLLLERARSHATSALYRAHFEDIIPHHGPGAVYDRCMNKGIWTKWFTTIESIYPYSKFFLFPYPDSNWDMEVEDFIRCRMIPVPKDSRGPRMICVHPAEAIWIQQGVRGQFEDSVCSFRGSGVWPRGHIHFDDQTVNAALALSSSADKRYATIDLEEASDRLSDWLVQVILGRYYRYVGCCRAYSTILPDGREVVNRCFAPMGNANTFPVQSLVFWSLCVATLERVGFHNPNDVYVFGDDIIVPTECALDIISTLHSVGLKVNMDKTFIHGSFRESCGTDAFNGFDVTPLRWKTCHSITSLRSAQSCCQLAQRLRLAGYHRASTELYSATNRWLTRNYGYSLKQTNNPNHGGLAEYVERDSVAWSCAYWHQATQQYVTPVLRMSERHLAFPGGWNHLLTSLSSLERTRRGCDPTRAPSRGLRLNRGWTPVL